MRGEMNSNWYEISFWLKISLRYFASSLLVFIWIEVKWNSKWYRYYIGHLDQNEISNRHEILIWTEFTRNEMNKCRVIGYCVQCACAFETHCRYRFHIGHFGRNKISFRGIKYHASSFLWTEFVLMLVWNLKQVWFYIAFHERTLRANNNYVFEHDLMTYRCRAWNLIFIPVVLVSPINNRTYIPVWLEVCWLYRKLTHFSPVSHFYTPLKRQETFGFLTFSGGMEMWNWTKMG